VAAGSGSGKKQLSLDSCNPSKQVYVMPTSFPFEPVVFLSKIEPSEFWIYSDMDFDGIETSVEIKRWFGTYVIDSWNGSVLKTVGKIVGGKKIWLAKLHVSHIPTPPVTSPVTPTSSNTEDLVNVSITITIQKTGSSTFKYEREVLPAIVLD
jgi:hypothetical protein